MSDFFDEYKKRMQMKDQPPNWGNLTKLEGPIERHIETLWGEIKSLKEEIERLKNFNKEKEKKKSWWVSEPKQFIAPIDGTYFFHWKNTDGTELKIHIELKKGCGFFFPEDSIPESRGGCLEA